MTKSEIDNAIMLSVAKNKDAQSENKSVYHPQHYNSGGIECIAGIKSSMSRDAYCGFLKGNVLKYIWRYEHKNGIEDLNKAKVYLDWLIEEQTKHTEHQTDDSVFLMSNGREK